MKAQNSVLEVLFATCANQKKRCYWHCLNRVLAHVSYEGRGKDHHNAFYPCRLQVEDHLPLTSCHDKVLHPAALFSSDVQNF